MTARRRRARRLLRAFRGGCIRGASPPSRGAHFAVGRRGRRGRCGRRGRLPFSLAVAAVQEPHACRRGSEGLQERGDRRSHRRSHPRPRRAQPSGDPADVGRQHPDLQEGHVRARHAQPHRDHHGHAHRHLQRAVPHRAEDPGGGAQAHAPQRHLGPHAVTRLARYASPVPPVPPLSRSSVVSSSSQTQQDHRARYCVVTANMGASYLTLVKNFCFVLSDGGYNLCSSRYVSVAAGTRHISTHSYLFTIIQVYVY